MLFLCEHNIIITWSQHDKLLQNIFMLMRKSIYCVSSHADMMSKRYEKGQTNRFLAMNSISLCIMCLFLSALILFVSLFLASFLPTFRPSFLFLPPACLDLGPHSSPHTFHSTCKANPQLLIMRWQQCGINQRLANEFPQILRLCVCERDRGGRNWESTLVFA